MSASERLKALQLSQAYIVRDDLERVLPQIVAVVEAAENYINAMVRPKPMVDLTHLHALDAALDALEEALS